MIAVIRQSWSLCLTLSLAAITTLLCFLNNSVLASFLQEEQDTLSTDRENKWTFNDAFIWIPTHGHTNVVRPAKTYVYQLCGDTCCRLEDWFSNYLM